MSGRPTRFLVVLLLALVVGVGAAGAAVTDVAQESEGEDTEDLVADCAAPIPEEFADPAEGNDTVGWVDGYWYDEPLGIEADDGGLNESELDALSARAAARFEALRCLTFEEVPEIEIVPRAEFEGDDAFADVTDDERVFDNAMLETMLLVGNETDSIDVREAERSTVVAGYYDFVEERIVVVSEDPDAVEIDEAVLAHELGHALQDQHFDLEGYERPTTDVDNGVLGMIEGDAQRIEYQYSQRCEADRWSEPCLTDDATAGEGAAAGEPPSWGLYFMGFQPYSDGPSFVDHVYEEGGWDAVDAVYEEMPSTSVHTIDPESYGEFEPEELAVDDESTDEWDRIETAQGPGYDVIGQAGLSAMLMDPAYDGTPIIPAEEFLNLENGEANRTNPLDYDHPETDGWVGDRLYVYGDGERTGTVWSLAWEDGEDAAEFADAYEQLIGIRGGEAVEGTDRTYEFGEASEFEGAVSLGIDDDRLWIVTAPSVGEIAEIHGDAVEAGTLTDDENDTVADADGSDDADTPDSDETDDVENDTGDVDEPEPDEADDADNETGVDADGDDANATDADGNEDDGTATDEPEESENDSDAAAGETAADEDGIGSELVLAGVGLAVLAALVVGAAVFLRRR